MTPAPPAAASQLLELFVQHQWKGKIWQTHGSGNHPTRGYVHAYFCEVFGVKKDIRIQVRWIAKMKGLDDGIDGRWVLQGPPALLWRQDADPKAFANHSYLGQKVWEQCREGRVASLKAARELVTAGDVDTWLQRHTSGGGQ